jgi:hypothetical protein
VAAGIDLLMLAHKAGAMVAATEAVRRRIAPETMATVIGTSTMSAYMNAFEFAQHATSQLQFYRRRCPRMCNPGFGVCALGGRVLYVEHGAF